MRGWIKEAAREISWGGQGDNHQPVDEYNISLSRNLKVYVFDYKITPIYICAYKRFTSLDLSSLWEINKLYPLVWYSCY